jgi:hypothetical protein
MSLDIIAITCFFNPCKYSTKKKNYDIFRANLKNQYIKLITVECAFGDEDYELSNDDADIMVRVRSNSHVWQKEALLNIGIKNIPEHYNKYVWLDCDILFEKNNWALETSDLLDKYCAVQPYSYAYRTTEDESFDSYDYLSESERGGHNGQIFEGYAYRVLKKLNGQLPKDWKDGGHTGFAWAFRKDSLSHLYDKMIIGGGDNLITHGLFGIYPKAYKMLSDSLILHHKEYIDNYLKELQGSINYTGGVIVHLWHGEIKNRQYGEKRLQLLNDFNFNPDDLNYNEYGCLEATDEINSTIYNYFNGRAEDG